MTLDRGLLLYGKPISIYGLGSVGSPVLKNIYANFENAASYNLIHAILSCSSKKMRELIKGLRLEQDYADMTDLDYDEASKFKLITHSSTLREMVKSGLSLFFDEQLGWVDNNELVIISDDGTVLGVITEQNYNSVEDLLKQTLYFGSEKTGDLKFANEAARKLWEEQNRLEESQPQSNAEDYQLPNIISKLSCGTTGYTIFSIYELTVYQLYDLFYSYSQNRTSQLGENAYAHWGGEDFDPLSWLHSENK